ncbi:MotA/TolQ/ExbB proton channel family protein [Sediminibacillus massiliensis]|uniref:MotA/TolQ/ExbB proton channel family protein n=1 Tax=Sediminibacillus massiliensis TaxID=1926277 RepID=UPI0009886791|nr:MotA/TolQ/ExbB proton channel family protein [Sediminibacillus massiliensis]
MLEAILQLFVSEQKAEAILSNGIIEFIFMTLFVTFIVTFLIHISLFGKLRKIRNYLNETNRMDIDPLRSFKQEYEQRQKQEPVKIGTFVQEKFSGWRVYNMPVVSLIKLIQMTVSVFILVGVLGTFIGLTISLGNLDSAGDQLVEDVASVLTGIDVAFYTSIAGMGLSLIMTVLIKAANTEFLLTDIMLRVESNLEEKEQNSLHRLIQVSETINASIQHLQETNQHSLQSIENSFSGFANFTTSLQQSAEDLAKFNDGLSENLNDFHTLFSSMKDITEGFGETINQLNDNFDQLFTYFKRMDGRNERMAAAFDETYKQIKELSTSQIDTLNHFEGAVEELRSFFTTILEGQGSIIGSFDRMNAKSNELVKRMEEHNRQFKGVFGDDISSRLSAIGSYLGELSKDMDKVGDSITHLPRALETIHNTQTEYRHLLSDRFDELRQFNQEFNSHLKAHSADSAAFERHLMDASSTYEQVGMRNNQLINEINSTILQMKDSFNKREDHIETSVGILRETLSRYVASLEGTLGDRLDKVGRSIGESAEMTNEVIKKEMKQISQISEETQQTSARAMQKTLLELQQEIQSLNKHLRAMMEEAMRRSTGRIRVEQHD